MGESVALGLVCGFSIGARGQIVAAERVSSSRNASSDSIDSCVFFVFGCCCGVSDPVIVFLAVRGNAAAHSSKLFKQLLRCSAIFVLGVSLAETEVFPVGVDVCIDAAVVVHVVGVEIAGRVVDGLFAEVGEIFLGHVLVGAVLHVGQADGTHGFVLELDIFAGCPARGGTIDWRMLHDVFGGLVGLN